MPFATGSGVGIAGVALALHSGLGNPDLGKDATFMLVSEKLAATCYSDDVPDACAARVREDAGEVMEKLRKLSVTDAAFEGSFWRTDAEYDRVMIDIAIAQASDLVSADSKAKLGFVRDSLHAAWLKKVKEAVDAGRLPAGLLETKVVASTAP